MASIKKKYKEISTQEAISRASYALTSDESTKVVTILDNFFTYFKSKHS
jgi:hypothetical protein